jgi:hypothetical protein
VLLANGKAVPISSLKPGEKLVATNTKTGKTQAGTIAAVLNKYKSGSQERSHWHSVMSRLCEGVVLMCLAGRHFV